MTVNNENNRITSAKATAATADEAEVPEKKPDRVLSTLGLAVRARRVACGTENVCEALRTGTAHLVLEACDNSANTHKRLTDRCLFYGVTLSGIRATSSELGAAAGRGGAIAAVAVTDASLARAVTASVEAAARLDKESK